MHLQRVGTRSRIPDSPKGRQPETRSTVSKQTLIFRSSHCDYELWGNTPQPCSLLAVRNLREFPTASDECARPGNEAKYTVGSKLITVQKIKKKLTEISIPLFLLFLTQFRQFPVEVSTDSLGVLPSMPQSLLCVEEGREGTRMSLEKASVVSYTTLTEDESFISCPDQQGQDEDTVIPWFILPPLVRVSLVPRPLQDIILSHSSGKKISASLNLGVVWE